MKSKILLSLVIGLLMVSSVLAITIDQTWSGSGHTLIITNVPHVETTIETDAGNFNGYQSFNIFDVTETRVSRMSEFSNGGYVSTTDRLTDADMDNTFINTIASSDGTGQVSIEDLGWSGTQLYASFNDDRYGAPWPQTPTYGQTRGLGEHFKAIANGNNAFVGVALGNADRGVSASATGSSVSANGRASFGYNWANVESPYSISSLTLTSN